MEHIGLEIHGMAYEFESVQDDPMHSTVFLSYKNIQFRESLNGSGP